MFMTGVLCTVCGAQVYLILDWRMDSNNYRAPIYSHIDWRSFWFTPISLNSTIQVTNHIFYLMFYGEIGRYILNSYFNYLAMITKYVSN